MRQDDRFECLKTLGDLSIKLFETQKHVNYGLFGASEEGNFSLYESRTDDIPQVSDKKIAYCALH
jgi:hypothetical protein